MLFFKKKKERYSGYTIDLGKLKDKGIIKDSPQDVAVQSSSVETSSADSLGFLGSLAGAGTANSMTDSIGEQSTTYNSPYRPAQLSHDAEGKLGSISERLYRLIDRIELIERKLERIERKLGYPEREY